MHPLTVDPSESGGGFAEETVCVPMTGALIARALDPMVPATKAEVLALAVQMGAPNGKGANYTLLKPAMKARYGLAGSVIDHLGAKAAYDAVMAAASAGPCVVGLAGDQAVLTPVWQPKNHVGHSICVVYENGTTGVQFDPLAPRGYKGDPFPPSELAKYATAAIIFKVPPEESPMPGFKSTGPAIGKFAMPAGQHLLLSPSDTVRGRYPQPAGGTWNVYARLSLVTKDGVPIDIDGNSPPLNGRDKVVLLDDPKFGAGAYALEADGAFTPAPAGFTQAQVDGFILSAKASGRAAGIEDAAKAAAATK